MVKGATRWVFIGRKRVYKIPSLNTYKNFLYGLLANLQEAGFSRTGWPELCPVLFSLPGGFLIVMPRCEPCTPSEDEMVRLINRPHYVVPAEYKPDSFGILDGRMVAIDYGS